MKIFLFAALCIYASSCATMQNMTNRNITEAPPKVETPAATVYEEAAQGPSFMSPQGDEPSEKPAEEEASKKKVLRSVGIFFQTMGKSMQDRRDNTYYCRPTFGGSYRCSN